MFRSSIPTILSAASVGAAILAAPAAAQDAPFAPVAYGQVHLGVSGVTDEDAFFVNNLFTDDGEVDYDTGYGFGGLLGYQFAPAFAVEAEVTGRANDFVGNTGDSDLVVTSFMANAVVSAPTGLPVVPYAGAGLGFASANLDDTDIAFAYQGKVGAFVPLRGPHAVGVEASYLRTDGFGYDRSDDRSGLVEVLEIDYAAASVMATYQFSFGGY